MSAIITFIISITAFILALTVHEFSHALTAYLLGDPTAKHKGRLTLNPIAHIDPLGLLLLIIIKFGWAKPVPFNPLNFTHPRLYSVLVGLAGPSSNLTLAAIFTILAHHIPEFLPARFVYYYGNFLLQSLWINVMLGIFNLIPVPPLDGSHLLRALMPDRLLPYYYFERYSFIPLIILITLDPVRNLLTNCITAVIKFFLMIF